VSYLWTLPNGATGTSNADTITIDFDSTALSGNISVQGQNICGDGVSSTLPVNVTPLVEPAGAITGDSSVCIGQTAVTYSVPVIANALNYIWTLPAGVSGSSTTNSITVDFGLSALSGLISVKGTNSCGDGITSNKTISVNPVYAFTQSHSMCDGETYVWQGTQYTTAGTYTATYLTIHGCDSIYTLNLTVDPAYAFTENHSMCNGETYVWQGTQYGTAGTYLANYGTIHGCDSIYTLDLTVNTVDTGVTVSGITLTANSLSDAYQWIDCNNGFSPINGAINQTYTATANGDYAVILTQGLCTDTSECRQITAVGIDPAEINHAIKAFPNPFTNELTLEITGALGCTNFEILNSIGQSFSKGSFSKKSVIQTSAWVPGAYIIKFDRGKTWEFIKMIKQ
jgi:hypothetical protein